MIDLDRLFELSGADAISFELHDDETDDHVVHFEYRHGPGKTSTFITTCDCEYASANRAARMAKAKCGE